MIMEINFEVVEGQSGCYCESAKVQKTFDKLAKRKAKK
jgi:hypothetical protein